MDTRNSLIVKLMTVLQMASIYIGSIFIVSLLFSSFIQDTILLMGIAYVIIIICFVKFYQIKQFELFNLKSITIKNILWTIFIWFTGIVCMACLPQETLENQQTIVESLKGTNLPTAIISLVILAPIVEEILFRSLLLQNLLKDKLMLGAIISSTLFALAHLGYTPISFLNYFIMSFSFSVVYMKTKSIECVMLAHIINNLIATLVAF